MSRSSRTTAAAAASSQARPPIAPTTAAANAPVAAPSSLEAPAASPAAVSASASAWPASFPAWSDPPQASYGWFVDVPPPRGPFLWPCMPDNFKLRASAPREESKLSSNATANNEALLDVEPQLAWGWYCAAPPPLPPYFWPSLPEGYVLVKIDEVAAVSTTVAPIANGTQANAPQRNRSVVPNLPTSKPPVLSTSNAFSLQTPSLSLFGLGPSPSLLGLPPLSFDSTPGTAGSLAHLSHPSLSMTPPFSTSGSALSLPLSPAVSPALSTKTGSILPNPARAIPQPTHAAAATAPLADPMSLAATAATAATAVAAAGSVASGSSSLSPASPAVAVAAPKSPRSPRAGSKRAAAAATKADTNQATAATAAAEATEASPSKSKRGKTKR